MLPWCTLGSEYECVCLIVCSWYDEMQLNCAVLFLRNALAERTCSQCRALSWFKLHILIRDDNRWAARRCIGAHGLMSRVVAQVQCVVNETDEPIARECNVRIWHVQCRRRFHISEKQAAE